MTEPDDRNDILAGTLDLLILQALSAGALHGLGVSRRIGQITRSAFDVKAGSLFPALQKLEQEGWLASEWGRSETNRRAKYYTLTKAGRRQLAGKTRRWNRIAAAIRLALQAT